MWTLGSESTASDPGCATSKPRTLRQMTSAFSGATCLVSKNWVMAAVTKEGTVTLVKH